MRHYLNKKCVHNVAKSELIRACYFICITSSHETMHDVLYFSKCVFKPAIAAALPETPPITCLLIYS